MVKERKIEAQPIHSDEKLVTTQTFERRAQFALSISTVLAVATIFMVISMVILWLFFRSYTQLLITSGVLLVMLVGSVAYHMLHRNGYTELGLYVLLISILIPVFAVGILMPDLLLAVSVGFLTQIALAILFLGDRQSRWFIAGGVVCLVADVVLANTVAADWFNPLEKTAAMVVAVAMGGIVLLVGNMVIRMMVLGQETQFRQAQLSSLEVERKAATEREQRVLMEQANQEIEKRAAAEQEQRRNLFNVLTQVNEAATDLNSASAEILAATTQQAAGASEQSAAISQTTTTVEEVKTISEQASMRSQEVATAAQRTVEVARMGQSSVQDTIGSMGEIKERVESIAENILSLSEQTQQIGEIISTVNEIASQPNMLALNASVEAARAGEHGKGFAVVAMEVRSLADQSKQATVQSLASTRQAEKSAQSLNELARKMADTVAQYKL